jgi:hypothetical protein
MARLTLKVTVSCSDPRVIPEQYFGLNRGGRFFVSDTTVIVYASLILLVASQKRQSSATQVVEPLMHFARSRPWMRSPAWQQLLLFITLVSTELPHKTVSPYVVWLIR